MLGANQKQAHTSRRLTDLLIWHRSKWGQKVSGVEMSRGVCVRVILFFFFCHLTFLSSKAETPPESLTEPEVTQKKEAEGDQPATPPETSREFPVPRRPQLSGFGLGVFRGQLI